MDVEIGLGRRRGRPTGSTTSRSSPVAARAIPDDVDIGWKLGDHLLELPLLASAMDGVVSPKTAIRSAGWAASASSTSRGSSPAMRRRQAARADRVVLAGGGDRGMQEIYARPVEPT